MKVNYGKGDGGWRLVLAVDAGRELLTLDGFDSLDEAVIIAVHVLYGLHLAGKPQRLVLEFSEGGTPVRGYCGEAGEIVGMMATDAGMPDEASGPLILS